MGVIMSRVTHANKRNWNPKIIKQSGLCCLFCRGTDIPLEYGHLNSNRDDSRPENLAFMCHSCNCKMIDDFDMRNIANAQLTKNEDAVLMCERMNKRLVVTEELTSCQAISDVNFKIAEQYVLERIVVDGYLHVKEGVDDVVGICRKNNNTGSQSAVYRYFRTLCSSAYPYEFAKDGKGEDIIRRAEN